MRNILGLDLGTNSIGWALVDGETKTIIKAGSRIIPMDARDMSEYETGGLQSAASKRTELRGARRLYERAILRRERLFRVLNILGFLPEHFKEQIDFVTHLGKFKNHQEPLLPYRKNAEGKSEFIFKDSFNEMVADFSEKHPEMVANGKKIPYDWTIYYLRKKALYKPIEREELAWIILNFNAKRGYYQLRGMEDETKTAENEEYKVLQVTNVTQLDKDKKRKDFFWYEITYENGAKQRKLGKVPPRKVGDMVEVIVTTIYDQEENIKTDKEGNPKISISTPQSDEWKLLKKKSENIIRESQKTVGEYIYDELITHPETKIRGKLVRVIDRIFYKEELIRILNRQREFIPELQDLSLYRKCIHELYRQNEAHILSIQDKTFTDFFVDDIIFYQRPKSKKSEISNCPFESYHYIDKETGEVVEKPIKCIPKSHPLFQEFRLWQFIQNLKIYRREMVVNGKLRTDVDVTSEFLTSHKDVVALYKWLNERKDITEQELLKYKPFHIGKATAEYRWNYVEERRYPCNETHYKISKTLSEVSDAIVLSSKQEQALWHILYSVDDLFILQKALRSFAEKNGINPELFARHFEHTEPFANDYGAYSEKAIKKLLPLMRTGMKLSDACYEIYGRYSEAINTERWMKPNDIDDYLRFEFKQHALRNPVVESVLGETLRVIRDIWNTYGEISEVHVEMGRDLKKNAKERKDATDRIRNNEQKNLRIRLLLQEFLNPEYKIEGIRPHSPSQMEIFKIYEENALNKEEDGDEEFLLIADNLGNPTKHVSKSDIMRYRLWLEQRYKSPYTGQPIPLSKLFTPAYEIEHIIPQSRYFDDSLSNKVICESEVNKLKDRMLGYEFITKHSGEIIQGNLGKQIKILDKVQYEEFVRHHYANNRGKMKKLLMDEIPDSFIERQLNDSRYIARKTISILSRLVREENEAEATSKNVIVTTGTITDKLKKEWGINDVWNDMIAPRFQRLNELTESNNYGEWVNHNGKQYFQINIPIEISRGFSKKRIDHRHHAMDAIVIACTTRNHVNYLNNKAALSSKKDLRYDLQHKLCTKVKTDELGNYIWQYNKPWDTFTQDVRTELQSIIVSFKQNLRVINKMTNYYWHYENGKKVQAKQTKGDGWVVRKSLHKATVSSAVRLQTRKTVRLSDALDNWHLIADKEIRKGIKHVIRLYGNHFDKKAILKYFKDRGNLIGKKNISKVEIYYTPPTAELSANRIALDTTFDRKKIDAITDSGIRKILLRHLENNENDPKIAFTPEGIAEMNRNIKTLNNGKEHKPIFKVRKAEALGLKFPVGQNGSKTKKFVEADKGTNLFFAIYTDNDGNRSFESIPFNVAVERMKTGADVAPAINEEGNKLLFVLSPGDLVYVPEEEEHVDRIQKVDRIYKMVSSSGRQCFFVPMPIAYPIVDTKELGNNNKAERAWSGDFIKKECLKLQVNRLGIITKIFNRL